MEENEPGWVEENQLADSLGWVCNKDGNRGQGDHHWCRFVKDDTHVWKARPRPGVEWVRAKRYEGDTSFVEHVGYLTLERALRGEK